MQRVDRVLHARICGFRWPRDSFLIIIRWEVRKVGDLSDIERAS